MSFIPKILLYGEWHSSEHLLKGYSQLFSAGQDTGCTVCFFERNPRWQKEADETMEFAASLSEEELREDLALTEQHYDNRTFERAAAAAAYVYLSCVLSGMVLYNVDIAPRPIRMLHKQKAAELFHEYSFQAVIDAFHKLNPAQLMLESNLPLEDVHRELALIERDLASEETWWKNYEAAHEMRMNEDHRIVARMLELLDGRSAVGIFGRHHVDIKRKNSIAGILAVTEGVQAWAYQIFDGALVPCPGKLSKLSNPYDILS